MVIVGLNNEEIIDSILLEAGYEPCPVDSKCITWIKPDDTVGLSKHKLEWHTTPVPQ